tara:strand:+ start:725 stop:910 length:186 start_codon:yes stop_codon:yes gene_type:complete
VDLNKEIAEVQADKIVKEFEVQTIGLECDVSKETAVVAMVDKIVSVFGKIDILHNNAASTS